jgi:hypothetical protein
MEKPYRILSLDGGGSWALIQVRCLQKMFGPDAQGHDVLRNFDLVAANSGGSIVAAGLAVNYRLSDLLGLFESEDRRREIFVRLGFFEQFGNQLVRKTLKLLGEDLGPRYSADKKLPGLRKNLAWQGENTPTDPWYLDQLPGFIGGDHPVHFLLCGFDYERRRAVFFRSDKTSRANTHVLAGQDDSAFCRVTLAEAVHASTNAPINYFNKPAELQYAHFPANPPDPTPPRTNYFWDGAVGGHNNPVKAAVVEALANGVDPKSIYALSLGTGSLFRPIRSPKVAFDNEILVEPEPDWGLLTDIPKIAGSILNDPPDAATFEAYAILNPGLDKKNEANGRLVRLNPLIQPVKSSDGTKWILPPYLQKLPPDTGYAVFEQLVKIDMDAIQDAEVEVIKRFCEAWLADEVPNQGIRWDSELKPVLGYGRFSDALNAWKAWRNPPPAPDSSPGLLGLVAKVFPFVKLLTGA